MVASPATHRVKGAPVRRVLFVTNIPSPYQVDFFTALSREPSVTVSVIFCSASETDRQFTVPKDLPFQGTILEGRRAPFLPKDWHFAPQLREILDQHRPCDMAVLSGSYFTVVLNSDPES